MELDGGKRLRKPRYVIRCAYYLKNHGKPRDELRTSTVVQEEILNELLVETGIGRLTTDIYEVKQAHEMADGEDFMPVP